MPGKRKYYGCKVGGCEAPHDSKGYCKRHYMQMKKSGKITVLYYEVNKPNEIRDYGNYIGIILKDRYGNVNGEALIDKGNASDVLQYKWHKTMGDYVARKKTGKSGLFFLHWHVIERQKDMVIDHINGNGLDNRVGNLRVCTSQENTFNAKISKNNASGVHGVSFHKPTKRWRAYINLDRKQIHLGMFDNIEDARQARVKAEFEYHKEFSSTMNQKNNASPLLHRH